MPVNERTIRLAGAQAILEQLDKDRLMLVDYIEQLQHPTPDTGTDITPREPAVLKRLHWTQRPENKTKLMAMHRKAIKTRTQKKGKR